MSLLSIITASYNSERTIEKTMNSILNQQHRPLEYIIIDGESSDQTCKIIKSKEKEFKLKGINLNWISEKDNGIYEAWNKGVKMALGSWISFLGSDDIYYPNSLVEYNNAISKNKNVDFVTAKARIMLNGKLVRKFGEEWRWNVFRKEMKILHAGGFLNKKYFSQYGLFNESYKITGDYEILLRKGEGLRVAFINSYLVEMDGGGISNSQAKEALMEARKAKINTANRNSFMATIEMKLVQLKVFIKSIIS